MPPTTAENVLTQLQWRYAVKKFDSTRKIPDATWGTIEKAMTLAPSSYGLQPWKFVVLTDAGVKAKLPGISWNQNQGKDCSHYVVLASRMGINPDDVKRYVQRICAVRSVPADHADLKSFEGMMLGTVNTLSREAANEWCARQCYIALGFLLSACAMLGVDACPMEGIEKEKFDDLLGLKKLGFATQVGAAVGYRASDDWLAPMPKVRYESKDVVLRI
jgi:nitroreductase